MHFTSPHSASLCFLHITSLYCTSLHSTLDNFSLQFRFFTSIVIFAHGATSPGEPGSPHYPGFTITLRHTTLNRSPLDEWSVRHGDLYLTTQLSEVTDIRAPGGIRTRNPRKRSVADPHLRPHEHRDRLLAKLTVSRKLENLTALS